jgi:hypothetical protein
MGAAVRVALGLLWWWAALRLALGPHLGFGPHPGFGPQSAVEAGVVLGGWSVSLLPVHCVPKERAAGVVVATGRWIRALRGRERGAEDA